MIVGIPLVISATGNSANWYLPEGDHSLFFTASSWGSATLQVSPNGNDYVSAEDSEGAITLTANKAIRVTGGCFYRLNVTSAPASITVQARPADR
jgi:hypothetical protein